MVDGSGCFGDTLVIVMISILVARFCSDDLKELCRPFGSVHRAHVAKDKMTGESRGFGFVTFHTKQAAELAIEKLHGFGYDHLVLSVDWSDRDKQRK